jgi:hypothetical protein
VFSIIKRAAAAHVVRTGCVPHRNNNNNSKTTNWFQDNNTMGNYANKAN